MATFAMPEVSTEIAFTNNPYDASPTWTDITQYVESITTTMGRQHELQQTAPSTATKRK